MNHLKLITYCAEDTCKAIVSLTLTEGVVVQIQLKLFALGFVQLVHAIVDPSPTPA